MRRPLTSDPTDPDPDPAVPGAGLEPRPIPREIAALRHLGTWLRLVSFPSQN